MRLSLTAYEATKKAEEIDSKLTHDNQIFKGAVLIIHDEGTTMFLQNAGVVKLTDEWRGVFAEHHPAMIFHKDDALLYEFTRNYREFLTEKDL